MKKIETKSRPWLVKYAVRGGTSYLTFDTRAEALVAYIHAYQCKKAGPSRVIGWPTMFKLNQPTVLEVGMSEL